MCQEGEGELRVHNGRGQKTSALSVKAWIQTCIAFLQNTAVMLGISTPLVKAQLNTTSLCKCNVCFPMKSFY